MDHTKEHILFIIRSPRDRWAHNKSYNKQHWICKDILTDKVLVLFIKFFNKLIYKILFYLQWDYFAGTK